MLLGYVQAHAACPFLVLDDCQRLAFWWGEGIYYLSLQRVVGAQNFISCSSGWPLAQNTQL